MITRIWHGMTSNEKAEDYLRFLLHEGTQEYRATDGNQSVKVWTKREGGVTHFWTVTEWTALDAVRNFAGKEYDKAKYYPADEGILLEFEEKVEHYEAHDVSNRGVCSYLRQLRQLYDGESWQAESISAKLRDLSEAEAFQQPMPGVHCVAEIVWHCIYWRMVFLKRIQGDQIYRDQTVESLNFLPLAELQKKGWQRLRTELDETQSEILGVLGEKTDQFLQQEYQRGYTFDYLVEGLVHHDVYHLGQIGLVIRMNKKDPQ